MAETYWDLFFAYTALWIIISLFLVKVSLKQKELAARVDELEARSE